MMQALHTFALVIHVITGLVGLLAGTIILFIRKGGKLHRRLGRVFFPCLLGVSFSAIALSLIRPNLFLLLIGGFTLYQDLTGYRAVKVRLARVAWPDYLITAIGALSAVPMLLSGQLVLQVFGGICALLVVRDVGMYVRFARGQALPRQLWLARHIGHMLGSYIAMVTAFLVVNYSGPADYSLVVWFAPTAVVLPLMILWARRFASSRPSVGTIAAKG